MDYNSLISVTSFSPKHIAHPDAWVGHLPFAHWLIKQINPKIFVELGTHSGNSYFSFCQTVKEEKMETKCYAVDTWQGDDHAGFYEEEIYSEVDKHNRENYSGFSRLLRMTFDNAREYFSEDSIELLHIDGLHTYEAVKYDFETWLPKLAPNAVVIFHDTNVRENNFGVWKFWEELQSIYPLNLEFVHSHGLSVLQISPDSSTKQLSWLTPGTSEQNLLKQYFAALGYNQIHRFNSLNTQNELQKRNIEFEKVITDLRQFVSDRDSIIKDLRQFVSDRDSVIDELKHFVSDRDSVIDELKQLAKIQQEEIFRSFHNTRTWRLTKPFRTIGKIRRIFQKKSPELTHFVNTEVSNNLDPGPSLYQYNSVISDTNEDENIISKIKTKLTFQMHSPILLVTNTIGEIEKQTPNIFQYFSANAIDIVILIPNCNDKINLEIFNHEDKFEISINNNDKDVLYHLAETLKTFSFDKAYVYNTERFNFSIERLFLMMKLPYEGIITHSPSIHPKHIEKSSEENNKNFISTSIQKKDLTITESIWESLKTISLINGSESFELTSMLNKHNKNIDIYDNISKSLLNPRKKNTNHNYYVKKNINSRPTLLIIPEIYDSIPSSCSYIRLIQPLLSSNIQEYFNLRVSSFKDAHLFDPDIIVTNRLPSKDLNEVRTFLHFVQDTNVKLVYDIDDHLLSLHDNHPEKSFYEKKRIIIEEFLRKADIVWTSTEKLATNLSPYCQDLLVVENYLEKSLLEVKENEVITSDFKVLYMGTTSHFNDLSQVIDSLSKLVSQGLNIQLNLIGITDSLFKQGWINTISSPPDAIYYPNFMKWLKTIGHFNLGIAPLENSIFNECKSDIKFWDYTAMGVPILASNIGAYSLIIKDGKNGLLTNSSQSNWTSKFKWALNNRDKLPNLVSNAFSDLSSLSIYRSSEEKRLLSLKKLGSY